MSFQKSHLELTLADVLQIVRGWLRDGELGNAHIRIGQAFGPLVREQVLFAIDVVQVALPVEPSAEPSTSETILSLDFGTTEHLSPYDKLEVVGVGDSAETEPDELRF